MTPWPDAMEGGHPCPAASKNADGSDAWQLNLRAAESPPPGPHRNVAVWTCGAERAAQRHSGSMVQVARWGAASLTGEEQPGLAPQQSA